MAPWSHALGRVSCPVAEVTLADAGKYRVRQELSGPGLQPGTYFLSLELAS